MNVGSKISVIGGSGFLGTSFCQLLYELKINFEIIDIKASRRFPGNYRFGDVRHLDSLEEVVSGDIVVNLAAIHRDDIRDKADYTRTNVLGAENICQVCKIKGIRKIIFTSTVVVYGFAEPGTSEDGLINPFNEYGLTKFQAEKIFRSWRDADSSNSLLIVRPTVIFGEGNRGNVYNLFNQISSGYFVMIGDGKNKKSMAYIENISNFLVACLYSGNNDGTYNYTDGPDLDMNSLVLHVKKILSIRQGIGLRLPYWFGLMLGYLADCISFLTNKPLPLSSIRIKKFCSVTQFTSNKTNLDNFVTPYTIEEGIERTLKSEFINPDPKREIFFTE